MLAKKYHPDLQTTQEAKKIAEEKIKTINEAYEILKDEEKKEENMTYNWKEKKQNTVKIIVKNQL